MTQCSRSHENSAMLVKRSSFVCVFLFCFFFSSPDAPDSFLHTGPLNPRKKKSLAIVVQAAKLSDT